MNLDKAVRAIIDASTPHYERKTYELTQADYERGYAWIDGQKHPIRPGQCRIEWVVFEPVSVSLV